MKLPPLSRSLPSWLPIPAPPRPLLLRLDGLDAAAPASWLSRTTVLVARSRCRLRWFRLTGIPAGERLAALRLQAQAWRPFDETAARLVLSGTGGLAIAWDAAAARQAVTEQGLALDRCLLLPETLAQAPMADGLRLLRGAEGFEAQAWKDAELVASRWWPDPVTVGDWSDFVRSSGASRDLAGDAALAAPPSPQVLDATSPSWAKHYPLDASGDGELAKEHRGVLAGALALTLVAGLLGQQLWSAQRAGQLLRQEIAEVKGAAAGVLAARDAALAQAQEVQKLADWFATPQPMDVVGHLTDTLARSGVQVKELSLEGDKLRLGLQLNPQATRAGIVKDLQAGGWLVDVNEARADNARSLLTMDMRISGPRPPVMATAAAPEPAPATAGVATTPVPSPVVAARANSPAKPPNAQTGQNPPNAQRAAEPKEPIWATPDANGMPPASVFDAIPTRK